MEKPGLFSPITINGMEMKNRIMMSPAFTNSADYGGFVSEWTIRHYQKRAQAGVGLVMVEHTSTNSYYIHGGNRLQISTDAHVDGFKRLAYAIQSSGAKAGLQIAQSIHALGLKPEDLPRQVVQGMVEEFVQGARRAYEAGFDAVELHFAHTYPLADFLSRRTNKRLDEYGGDVYGRMRLHLDIIKGIRATLGRDYPLFACISADEFIIGGNTLKDTRIIAPALVEAGIDCLDVTAGVRFDDGGLKGYSDLRGKPTLNFPDGPNVYLAEDLKKYVSVPVIARGKLGNPDFTPTVIEEGRADIVAMIRPLLADDKWVKKVQSGHKELVRTCVNCNACLYKRRTPDDPVRCMERDCAKCLTCLRNCPYHLPFINEKGELQFANEWCDECGMCAGICPAHVVRFQADPQYNWVKANVAPAVAKLRQNGPKLVVIACASGPFAGDALDRKFTAYGLNNQVALIRMPCPGKLSTQQMLNIFQLGVEGILVAACDPEENPECKFRHHHRWARSYALRSQQLLASSGLENHFLRYISLSGLDVLNLVDPVKSFYNEICTEIGGNWLK